MRDFKFRIWDNQNKKLRYLKNIDCDSQTLGFTCRSYIDMGVCNEGKLKDWQKEKFTIQQFTGIKDKNGSEIYEGDIVKFVSSIGGMVDGEEIGAIEFNDGCFGVKCHPLFNIYKENLEIIGNIFETPELL